MHALITRLSVSGTSALRMKIEELLSWRESMRGVYSVVTGVYMYTTEAEIEVVVLGFFLISQVMDRLHKKAYAHTEDSIYFGMLRHL